MKTRIAAKPGKAESVLPKGKSSQKITPCLWFDSNAEEAANFYTSIFKNSNIGKISRYGEAGYEIHGKPAGTVVTIEFELNGTGVYSTQRRSDIQIQ